ncbi:hypothetical protein V6B14_12710 [Sporosarcina psychrophila]
MLIIACSILSVPLSEFFWGFHNWKISFFAIENMDIMSDIRYLEGGKGIMEGSSLKRKTSLLKR